MRCCSRLGTLPVMEQAKGILMPQSRRGVRGGSPALQLRVLLSRK